MNSVVKLRDFRGKSSLLSWRIRWIKRNFLVEFLGQFILNCRRPLWADPAGKMVSFTAKLRDHSMECHFNCELNFSYQGKIKKTKKFATMKRMISLKDSRMWVGLCGGSFFQLINGLFSFECLIFIISRLRRKPELRQDLKKKKKEPKQQEMQVHEV